MLSVKVIVIPESLVGNPVPLKSTTSGFLLPMAPTSGYAGMTAKTSGAILLQEPLSCKYEADMNMQ